jgi:hypothetical protein
MAPKYKVVSFVGQIKSGFFSTEGPHTASQQLEDVINTHVNQGWEFCEVSHIDILVQPGCLAGLLGAKVSTVVYDQVIFRRQA